MRDIMAVILGGGRGSRLFPLTKVRSKPAVQINGKYRLIDIPISNCLNSNIYRIFVLTQFNSASLNRHIDVTYHFDSFRMDGFVNILAAEQTQHSSEWFQGTADAVRKTLKHYDRFRFSHYLILSGDHVYRMDYRKLLKEHRNTNADVTVAAMPVERQKVSGLGVMEIDDNGFVKQFVEKPEDPELIDKLEIKDDFWKNRSMDNRRGYCLANMGIYVFKRELLEEILTSDREMDFGKEIFPHAVESGRKVYSYLFEGYWEDIGTIKSFHQANLGFVNPMPKFSFYDEHNPIFTHARYLPPSKITRTTADNAILSEGCIVDDAYIRHSIIGVRSRVGKGSTIIDTYMMGSDYFESADEREENRHKGLPDIGIGHDCHLEGVIIDKDARIGNGVRIVAGPGDYTEGDGWVLRDGVIVVEKRAIIPEGTQIVFR